MIKKLLPLICALGFSAGSQAATILSDNFSATQGPLQQTPIGTQRDGQALGPCASRVIGVNVLTAGTDASNISINAGALGFGTANTGSLGIAEYMIGWGGCGGLATLVGGTLSFDLVFLDQNPMGVALYRGDNGTGGTFGTGTLVQTIAVNNVGLPKSFSFSGLTGDFGSFYVKFTGQPAYDFVVDNMRIQVPEPATLALIGLGLLGLGVVRRRA